MHTNVHHESTEYTEQTESLADVGHIADDIKRKYDMLIKNDQIIGLRLLGGLHPLRGGWRSNQWF